MKKTILTLVAVIATVSLSYTQIAITEDGSLPDNSAMLDINSTSKGMLIPRMTSAQRDAISNPAKGLMVFVTTDNQFYYNEGTAGSPAWIAIGDSGTDGDWTISGNNVYSSVSGNVGIGTSTPSTKLQVTGNIMSSGKLIASYGSGNNASYRFGDGSENTGFSSPASETVVIVTDGVERMRIKSDGSIGIGTISPGAKLGVAGQVKITGGDPGDGKVLTSDASGLGSWQNIPAGVQELDDLNDAKTDNYSIFLGQNAGENDNGFNYNTGVGIYSLQENISGARNVALGTYSNRNNTTGGANTTLGYASMYNNQTGYSNVAIGVRTLYSGTANHNIVAIGDSALRSNGLNATIQTHGSKNTAVGSKSMFANTIGAGNTALGSESFKNNTNGNFNTAIGNLSLKNSNGGNNNTAIGNLSAFQNSTGDNNVAIGSTSLYSNTVGTDNVAIGTEAGFNATGSGNVFIGNEAGADETGSNKLYIDNSDTPTPLIKGDFSANTLDINGELVIAEKTQVKSGSDASLGGGGFLLLGLESGKNIVIDNNEIMARNNGVGSALYIQHESGTGNTILNNYDGNVGIGTMFPSSKLHVEGSVRVSNSILAENDIIVNDDLHVLDDVLVDDQIIANGYRYVSPKTYVMKIPAAEFGLHTNQDADRMYFNISGYWHMDEHNGNGASNLQAGVNLPDGAIITRFSLYYRNYDATISAKLQKIDGLAVSPNIIASYTTTSNHFDMSKSDDTSISYATVDNDNSFYYITIEITGVDDLEFVTLQGAEIEYTINKISN